MTCPYCDPRNLQPGSIIRTTDDLQHCIECGGAVDPTMYYVKAVDTWDTYFHSICVAVASKSPCHSRKIGAILVRDHSIVSTGFNGPSRGIPHCGHERYMKDKTLGDEYTGMSSYVHPNRWRKECPRKILGYESGTHMEICPAQHAEENAVSNAARLGVSTIGTTLYMNCIIPCKNCFGTLINAGITDIVVDEVKSYDVHTQYLIDNSNINIRRFEL
jgi:dCMP deaminase